MANYYAIARSNYFKVTDVPKFKQICKDYTLTVIYPNNSITEVEADALGEVGFYPTDGDIYHPDSEGERGLDELLEEISKILQPNEVCIYQEIGYEKLRYLCGYSVAINSEGETLNVSIDDIYALAKEKLTDGVKEVSTCAY